MENTEEKALLPEVADKYDLQHIKPGCYDVPNFGIVDLTTLTVDQADKLVGRGFPYFVAKSQPAVADNSSQAQVDAAKNKPTAKAAPAGDAGSTAP